MALGELVRQWADSASAAAGGGGDADGSGYADYAAAALAGLPENDDAVRMARLAHANGQTLETCCSSPTLRQATQARQRCGR
eukprot:jgi/Tetstr1/445493/TSEL_033269.t1